MEAPSPPKHSAGNKPENPWFNLGFNIIFPGLLLMKSGKWFDWNPTVALCVALAFPLGYGIFDLITRRKFNFLSALGFISVLFTGGVGLLKLDKEWIAIKEAAIPALIGLAVLVSLKTPYPLIRTFLYNDKVIDVPRVEENLRKNKGEKGFENLLFNCTVMVAASFLLSATLNYALARYFIKSEAGTRMFNEELGRMTFWSWPIIVIPSMIVLMVALWSLIKGIKNLTGLTLEEVLKIPGDEGPSPPDRQTE